MKMRLKTLDIKIFEKEEFSWIKKSDLYKSFETDEDSVIQAPYNSDKTRSISKFLNTINFWGFDFYPEEFFKLLFKNKDKSIKKLKKLYEISKFKKYEDLIQILSNNKNDYSWEIASKNGYLDLVIFLHKNNYFWKEKIEEGSFLTKNYKCYFRKIFFNGSTMKYASENGHLHIVKYLIENGCILDVRAIDRASENGHLHVVKFLHENGAPWDEYACRSAAGNGHLHLLKYLHENGCPWDENTNYISAEYGELECLKYAHENGCPWDEEVCQFSMNKGNLECLKYAHQNGCPLPETILIISKSFTLECLKYLYENGIMWDRNSSYFLALGGKLDCLEYAHKNGCNYDKKGLLKLKLSKEIKQYISKNM